MLACLLLRLRWLLGVLLSFCFCFVFKVTLDNLKSFTGATVDESSLRKQITDDELREALLEGERTGVSYDVVSLPVGVFWLALLFFFFALAHDR